MFYCSLLACGLLWQLLAGPPPAMLLPLPLPPLPPLPLPLPLARPANAENIAPCALTISSAVSGSYTTTTVVDCRDKICCGQWRRARPSVRSARFLHHFAHLDVDLLRRNRTDRALRAYEASVRACAKHERRSRRAGERSEQRLRKRNQTTRNMQTMRRSKQCSRAYANASRVRFTRRAR